MFIVKLWLQITLNIWTSQSHQKRLWLRRLIKNSKTRDIYYAIAFKKSKNILTARLEPNIICKIALISTFDLKLKARKFAIFLFKTTRLFRIGLFYGVKFCIKKTGQLQKLCLIFLFTFFLWSKVNTDVACSFQICWDTFGNL